MRPDDKTRPLTDIEKAIAAEHHDYIYSILSHLHMPLDEYYDIAAIGYLRGVQDWLTREELNEKCSLWTICKYRVWREIAHYKKSMGAMKRNPAGGIVSLDYQFDFNDDIGRCIAEIIDDGHRFEDNICGYDSMIEILSLLTRRQRHIALMRMSGYTNSDIAKRLGLNPGTISVELKRMREIIKASRM